MYAGTGLKDPGKPFSLQWMDSSYQETLLTDSPWAKVEELLNKGLADKIMKQIEHADRREMIFHLLGQEFVQKHFPEYEQHAAVLEPPHMSRHEKEKLQAEAQSWLQSQLSKTASETGCHRPRAGEEAQEDPCPEMIDFLTHTYQLYSKGLERELYVQEKSLTQKKLDDLTQNKAQAPANPVPYKTSSLFHPMSAGSDSTVQSEKPSTSHIKANLHKVSGEPPTFWGPQSDLMGSALSAVLKRDPRRFEEVSRRLHGRQLPGGLRNYMWIDVLFRAERQKMKDLNVEKIVRERFGKAVARGVGELRIKRATHSPINGLIENAVIEIYESTPSMMPFNYELHLKESARSLNILYVYNRSYEPYLIHWLFPLQIAFREQNNQVLAEHIYELAMYIDLFSQSCFPKWPEVFAVAEKVMSTLGTVDLELHDHLRTIAFKNVKVNPKEFLVQLLHLEQTKAQELAAATPRSGKQSQVSKDLLADPLIFLRKWIGEGFVSVLDTQAVLLIWDQCFMQGWRSSVLQDACLALVLLLKHKFMEATDYHSMKQVFLKEPCKLYTVDIQRAWIHIQNGGNAEDVPYMNRQRPQSGRPVVKSAPSAVVKPPTPSSTISLVQLPPVGIKHIRVKLIFPADAQDRVEWLADFDPSAIKVFTAVYFGSIRIGAKWSSSSPACLSATSDKYGSTVYAVDFNKERFVFTDMDATSLDVEREMGGFPYAILRIDYDAPGSSKGGNRVSLGWSRIPLFQHSGRGSQTQTLPYQWELLDGEYTHTLYSGPVSESFLNDQPRTPLPSHQDLLAENCQLSAVVYDPTVIPETPDSQVATPKTREPTPPEFQPWVPFNPMVVTESDPAPSGLVEPFTLFIDGVNFIPDNATIIKVTGRVLKTGKVANIPDILAFPELTSPARCPKFRYSLHVNENGDEIDPGVVALLRVYTVDVVTGELVVIGSCLAGIFDEQSQLLVGGQQLRLRSGMPDLRNGLAALKVTDLDDVPPVPGASLLIRVLPGIQVKVDSEVPDYQTGYYRSEACQPTWSEERIFESFMKDKSFYRKTSDIARLLLEKEQDELEDNSTRSLSDWIEGRLDNKVHLPPKQPANSLDLTRCVKYRINIGLTVKIAQAFGLPEGLFVECFALVVPGSTTKTMEATEEGFGHPNYKFVTLKHDYDSLQKAPVWLDEPKVVHPYYDPNAFLLVQVFSMNGAYKPTADHQSPGQVVDKSGGQLSLDSVLGWSVVQLFDGGSVLCGEHHVPVLKGKPPQDLLSQFEDSSVEDVLRQQKWNSSNKYQTSQLVIRLWDSHYDISEHPPVPLHDNLLSAVGDVQAYERVASDSKGKAISQMVVDSLERKYKKLGTNSSVYSTEREFYEQVMNETFYNQIENALMGAGYGPL